MSESGWFISGMTTAAGVAIEIGTSSNANWSYSSKKLRLEGLSVQMPSSIAASTVMATLRFGESSGVGLSTTPLVNWTAESAIQWKGLKFEAPYFAIVSPATCGDRGGFLCAMWGSYV